ncbi:glycosyltransferase 1 domain-containing protein 1 isoform X2 [Nerophis lumbriciformis]|uniref:glycosyltransferase 1 domain-containing protein 1 isoform X2 n=1 Tax=Nerophis lumbriciformis TaxID=546530 RepID=UPI002AE04388|nr:glycosyltransferase 1 domain-containing protein 1-like isoform X2 [Nerophis lumbriciformis]
MKLLFLACLEPKTGNHTTAERIRSHIESAGHTCELHHAEEFQSSSDLANLLSQNIQFDGALAIHLFKAGRLLLDIQVPFGIVFGGTDINEDVKVEKRRAVMENVLLKARFAVAFTEKMKQEAMSYLHSQSSKTYVQPQGIRGEHVERLHVFLLICGLRRVKDPLYLVESFSEWHSENPQNVLVIIGPKIDPVLTDAVEAVVRRTAGVFLAQERSQPELHAAMKRCFAMVNSSISEGMSAAILEAMDLGLPVLARNIPGNTAIVQNEVTGLVYSSPQEFVHQSQRLLSDHQLRARVIRNGKVYVVKHHSLKQERETYQRLVNMLH